MPLSRRLRVIEDVLLGVDHRQIDVVRHAALDVVPLASLVPRMGVLL